VGHALRSSGLLRVEASQSELKIGGGAMAGGACGTIIDIVSRSS
jgi:hypothetical protein